MHKKDIKRQARKTLKRPPTTITTTPSSKSMPSEVPEKKGAFSQLQETPIQKRKRMMKVKQERTHHRTEPAASSTPTPTQLSDDEEDQSLKLKLHDDDAEVVDRFYDSSSSDLGESEVEAAPNDDDDALADDDDAHADDDAAHADDDDAHADVEDEPPSPPPVSNKAVPRKPKRPAVRLTEENERLVAQWLETHGEFIYNKAHKDYKDKHKVARAWAEIGATLDPPASGEDLKVWFYSMRSRYGRLTTLKSGSGAKLLTYREIYIKRLFEFCKHHIVRQRKTVELGLPATEVS